jgi:SAM-dependent methyltransferase
VLDLGCGVGTLLSALSADWEKHGVELSAFAGAQASKHASVHVGPVHSARYPSSHFDLVVFHHVIEHLDDPVAAVRECFRILKADGTLLVGTPDFDSECARRFGENFRLLHDPTHVSLFSRDSLRRLLEDEGFAIERVDSPYFDTPYFTRDNLERLFDPGKVSPPFVGNVHTFYCKKPRRQPHLEALVLATRLAARMSEECAAPLAALWEVLHNRDVNDGTLFGVGTDAAARSWRRVRDGGRGRSVSDEHSLQAAPGDALLVFDLGEPPPPGAVRLLEIAARGGLPSVCIAREGRARLRGDVGIELPSATSEVTDLALSFVIEALRASVPPG